ncbi:hypothetical protein CEN40_00035 [Fischerella thermalis CCMEE 5205]|uniref:Uncharacterized protein n=1 Tax=Fischerella thermalis CCMEE 5318 TaxID=2019666 RepID=A0A2N6LF36_9CYAN|nr:hypothetical protein [Fischerella thermalis]PMB22190.1 hypothetical protein CEN46_12865 [Fischerella thermalis CCMEE 5318]PMB51118.1 hypothetical protein CEN40_00035 [Fischerella thermalis CCMEE 5205]
MNYKKLDAALAMALNQVQDPDERSLVVFIHTQPVTDNSNAAAILENLGISGITEKKDVFSATLSVNEIAKLSEQPWVQYLKLSQKLRLVDRQWGSKSVSVNKY